MYTYMYTYIKGTVHYISQNGINDNESIGIELDKSLAQGHDEKYNFSIRHDYGLFVTKDIHKVFLQLSELIFKKYFATEFAKGTWVGLVLDDFLANATDGTVKWPTTTRMSGASHWSESGLWDPNANDGTFNGQTLFQTKMGRDLFTRRQSVLHVLSSKSDATANVPEYDVSFNSRNKKNHVNADTDNIICFCKKNESTGVEMYAANLQTYNNTASQNYHQMLHIFIQ
ncbi:hypothetical protein RFI_31380 [Reticulomyxa filosa]|uniref:Uncharacterized protein n=1 Tax=Reticulomyxa filosa TaxID=46433 RepID=X6LXD2_RETFI|nr:hypothetical protein RFI_31380 [Reticulomyxa filosa]|eukprot:ETO06016.1 hypothetical protein RFI_31380 [Reticulomyxa filosa]